MMMAIPKPMCHLQRYLSHTLMSHKSQLPALDPAFSSSLLVVVVNNTAVGNQQYMAFCLFVFLASLLPVCRLEGEVWGVLGRDDNENGERLRKDSWESSQESKICLYFANIFIYSHIKEDRH